MSEEVETYAVSPTEIMGLGSGLAILARAQRFVSGMDPAAMEETEDGLPSQAALATYGLALATEVMELVKETSWRPWRDPQPVDVDRFLDEMADVLAFLGLWFVYAEKLLGPAGRPDAIAQAYFRKHAVNVARLNGSVEGFGARERVPTRTSVLASRSTRVR